MAAPELGTRQFGSPRARPDCLHTLTPGTPATSALTARSRARTRRYRRRRHAVGDPSTAPPSAPPHLVAALEPYPRPTGSPISLPHFVDGKTESLQQQFPNVIASKPDPGGLDTIQPLSAAV